MINLFSKDATNFASNGLATLYPVECVFYATINDVWQLKMTLPYEEWNREKLVEPEQQLKVTGINAVAEQTSSYQLFRIYDVQRNDDYVEVTAYPVGLDARFDTYVDTLNLYYNTSAQAITAINNLSSKYTVTTDVSSNASAEYNNTNIISILNGDDGFVNKWGGEICYDNYNIKVNSHLGSDNGVSVRYGKNIRSMSYEVDTSGVVTRIYPKSAMGESLNAISSYKIADYPYVDSSHIDANLPHIYFVQTPYNLVQLQDDGSVEYAQSIAERANIVRAVYGLVTTRTAEFMNSANFDYNLSLEWMKNRIALTLEDDGEEGYAERIARLFCAQAGFVSDSFKDFIKGAIIDGFTAAFEYIDTSLGWMNSGSNYTTGGISDWKMKSTWAQNGKKWCWLNSNGYFNPEHPAKVDETEWKWYSVTETISGTKVKRRRFGNKKKNGDKYYLYNRMAKVNDEWIYFDSNGVASKNAALRQHHISGAMTIEGIYDSIANTLVNDGYGILEESFYYTLYSQMTAYCQNLYSQDGLDLPNVTIDVDIVDLKNTLEYENYEDLITIRLGDTVQCYNSKLGIITSERIIGVEYDVLKGYNQAVTIGTPENTTINLLNDIGKKEGIKFVAGEGITIENNVISVIPPTPPVKDVRVKGVSVVSGGIADIDIDESVEGGLQYFIETENALYGSNDYMELIKDGRFLFTPETIKTATMTQKDYAQNWYSEWTVSITPLGIDEESEDDTFLFVFTPETDGQASSYPLYINNLQHDASFGGVLLLTSNIDAIEGFLIQGTYYDINYNTGQTSSSAGSNTISSIPTHDEQKYIIKLYDNYGREIFYNNPVQYARTTVEIDGDTWYGMWFWKANSNFTECNFPSIEEYLPKAELPHNAGAVVPYSTLGQLVTQAVPLWKPADGSCSGIAKANNLAFFAGGDDEFGTNAPIKIFTNGTYQGLDKVEDVTVDGVSVVTNKIAAIQNPVMTGATSQTNGVKGLVPAPTIAERTKFLRGDGTWAQSASSIPDLTDVNLTNLSDKEILRYDSTSSKWVNSTDLEPIEITKAEYDLLSQAEKEAEDKVYFITDYNGMDLDVQVNGTSIISGGVADVTTEEVLNPSGLVGYVDVRSKPDMTDIDQNLTVLTQMSTFEFDFDYKFHRWISGGSAWLQEYNVNIDSRQGQVASSYKHSEWNDVAEGYELTHYTEEKTSISPNGIECHHETIGDENPDTGLTTRGLCQYALLGADGLYVYEYDYENDEEVCALDVSKNDIVLKETTWDGTNDSLKDAIAALSARITALGG